ncbi:MAG: hypothetical protein Q7S83_01845 [bacterium]|nr:hypothetical protein [bacterium]
MSEEKKSSDVEEAVENSQNMWDPVIAALEEINKDLKGKLDTMSQEAEQVLQEAKSEMEQVAASAKATAEKIQAVIDKFGRAKSGKPPDNSLIVNYGKSISQLIGEAGFSYVNSDITEKHFNQEKTDGTETLECKMYHFSRDMNSDNVVAEMKRDGFEPASLKTLLHYQMAHPDEHKQYPIVGLGNPWRGSFGNRRVPYLYWFDVRKLNLYWFGSDWYGSYRFLAVRKS